MARPRTPVRARRRPRHVPEAAKALIADAAVDFLSRRPLRELTVEKLMVGTPLSRPAFYQYYRDVHELMEALLAGLVRDIGAVANPWLAGIGDPETALRESLRGVVRVGAANGPVLRAIAEAAPHDTRLERAWTAFLRHWDDVVAARIEAQQAQGLVPAMDARALASALNALDAAVLIRAFGRRPRADPEGVLDVLHRIWSGALYAASTSSALPRGRRDLKRKKEKSS